MAKTPQPIWHVRVRSSGLQIDSRFFLDRAQAYAFGDRMDQYGYAVVATSVPLLDTFKAFRMFMADAA